MENAIEDPVPGGHAAVGGAAEAAGTSPAAMPASDRAARTAVTPMAVPVSSPKRPKGWRPTPVIRTPLTCGTPR